MTDLCEVVITAPDPDWLLDLTRQLVAEGLCASIHNFARGIARELWVTEGTVEKHIGSILTKLRLPETDDTHRHVLAVLTILKAL